MNRAPKIRAARPALRAHSRRDRVQTEGSHGKPQTLREEENTVLELTQVEIWWSSQIKALRYRGEGKEKEKFLRPKRSLTFFLPKYHALNLQQQHGFPTAEQSRRSAARTARPSKRAQPAGKRPHRHAAPPRPVPALGQPERQLQLSVSRVRASPVPSRPARRTW